MPQYTLRDNWLEISFAEKDLGILLVNKLTLSQQHVLVAKKAIINKDHCQGNAIAKVKGNDPSPLFSPGVTQLECRISLPGNL